MNEMKNLSGKNYPDERIISLWFTRLMSGQYKFKNCSQGLNTSDFGAKIMVLEGSRMRCLVADDESLAIKGMTHYIGKLGFLQAEVSCSSAVKAADVLKRKEIDLMFLDINMPYLSGLDFLESLDNPPLTIITTAYSEYALEGFRLNVVDYLMKPIAFKRFLQAVCKAQDMFRSHLVLKNANDEAQSGLYVRQGESFQRITRESILYVKGMKNYLKLHFKDRVLTIHQTMASLEEMLPQDCFFRINRSFLVNIAYIESIAGGRLFINGKELPVSEPRREELMNRVVYKNLISK